MPGRRGGPLKPRKLLDCIVTPDNRELALYQHGDSFFIDVDGEELMSSRAHGSEDSLARLAIGALGKGSAAGRPPRVLVGGLGMGFTLRATLDALTAHPAGRKGAEVVVAEVFPAIVEWNRGPLGHLAGRPLDDSRARVELGDVARHLEQEGAYDVVLLDVDNGPEAFTLEVNRHLYTRAGIERWFQALPPGGVLAVWSAGQSPPFEHRLRRAGFQVKSHGVAARASGKGGRHTIFLAVKPGRAR